MNKCPTSHILASTPTINVPTWAMMSTQKAASHAQPLSYFCLLAYIEAQHLLHLDQNIREVLLQAYGLSTAMITFKTKTEKTASTASTSGSLSQYSAIDDATEWFISGDRIMRCYVRD